MTTISYETPEHNGKITWAANECFAELNGKTFSLNAMEATSVAKLEDLSFNAKLLLSAVAGAIIQRLLDQGISPNIIFDQGKFTVQI